MHLNIKFNDAWGMIPSEDIDAFITFFEDALQPSHPLRAFKLYPFAKCWRLDRYLIEEQEPSERLWILDLQIKKRFRGKTIFYFKLIQTQEELDALLQADYEVWVQHMKDAGAWDGA